VRRRPDLLIGAAAALVSLVGATLVLRLWHIDWHVPLDYTGDTVLNLTVIKTVMEHGWYLHNPDLGLPHGQELYDYPVVSGETLNLLFFRLAGLFTDDPVVVLNVFYVLTYPLTALTAYFVLRRVPLSREVSLVIALLFTWLPYHFLRGEVHVFLAAYYAVPFGAYLVLAVLRGDPLLGRWRPTLVTVALCAVIAMASGSFYYSAFTVFLVAVAALLRFVARGDRQALVAGGAVVGAIAAVSLVQLAPTIVYHLRHGGNDEVAHRYWFESEVYGLKLTNLVLPIEHHRIGPIARAREDYVRQIPQSEARVSSLGLVGAVGFLWLLGVALAACVGVGRRFRLGLHGGLAAVTLAAFLASTTGGLSTLFGVIWPQIRAWSRISVFIAFFSLIAVALLFAAVRHRIPPPAFLAALAVVLVGGALDQTSPAYIPAYTAIEDGYRHDGAFIRSVEARLPEGAAVVQVPYEPFPEPPLNTPLGIYEPAKPYLHSEDLRWSWGAMRGRPGDWMAAYAGKPAAEVVAAARERGFRALLLDRGVLGAQAAAAEADYRNALGAPVLANDRYDLWRL
jgi:phosphoglycerol transferase